MNKTSFNVLIATEQKETAAQELVLNSKYLNKLYSTIATEKAIEVKFNTFKELAHKCKTLKIDVVIVENQKWILQGIADVLKKNFVNCIALTSQANKLLLSYSYSRKLLDKYGITVPAKLLYPTTFPVVIKSDGSVDIGYSIEEIIQQRENIANQSEELARTVFLEEFIEGEYVYLISLFDGKNLLSFTDNALVKEYSKKLEKLLVEEKFEFIGFINSKLIISSGKVYNIGFSLDFSMFNNNIDFIYLLNSAIYQKLDEIKLLFPKN